MSLVGDSKFESWYQAHPKANGGDKQLARDAYEAGMNDPISAEELRNRVAKTLIDQLHMLGYSGVDAETLWQGKETPSKPKDKVDYAWECNECGSQEYTMSVSEADVHDLGCGRCGSSEWHKVVSK